MHALRVILWLLGWALVAAPFELAYWVVSRIARCKMPKHEICGLYWVLAAVAVFVILDRSLSGADLVLAALVCGLHLALCDQFTKLTTRKGRHVSPDRTVDRVGRTERSSGSQTLNADKWEAEQ